MNSQSERRIKRIDNQREDLNELPMRDEIKPEPVHCHVCTKQHWTWNNQSEMRIKDFEESCIKRKPVHCHMGTRYIVLDLNSQSEMKIKWTANQRVELINSQSERRIQLIAKSEIRIKPEPVPIHAGTRKDGTWNSELETRIKPEPLHCHLGTRKDWIWNSQSMSIWTTRKIW
jgi:hypothetical protein